METNEICDQMNMSQTLIENFNLLAWRWNDAFPKPIAVKVTIFAQNDYYLFDESTDKMAVLYSTQTILYTVTGKSQANSTNFSNFLQNAVFTAHNIKHDVK